MERIRAAYARSTVLRIVDRDHSSSHWLFSDCEGGLFLVENELGLKDTAPCVCIFWER
jgi:hypothetical protein